jgi:hypothetical protein
VLMDLESLVFAIVWNIHVLEHDNDISYDISYGWCVILKFQM